MTTPESLRPKAAGEPAEPLPPDPRSPLSWTRPTWEQGLPGTAADDERRFVIPLWI